MGHKVRIMRDGEVTWERDYGDSDTLAKAGFSSAENHYRRLDDDMSEGATIQRLEGGEIREEGTFCMGEFEYKSYE